MENNDFEKKPFCEAGPDPSAPITRRGILMSLVSNKPMEIPEQDVVSSATIAIELSKK